MSRLILAFSAALYGACLSQMVLGADSQRLAEVQVTATRVEESVDLVPASLAIVRGEDLRRLGATNLRSALASIAGLDAPAGGDAGPAGSVPSFWGLHEFDAFLLVVDGVPWGGAFNPALPALDLNDVERIEVMKGAAPVMFGATSFVGVIHVIRYPAGESDHAATVAGGSRSSAAGSVSTALPAVGAYKQSMLLDADRTRFPGRDQGYERAHALYRGAAPLLEGTGGVDLEYLAQTQLPASPVVRSGGSLTTATPLDGNFNPADAGIVGHRTHLVLNYTRGLQAAEWRALASYSYEETHDVRGFLRPELSIGADGANADGFNQDRRVRDVYLDSFVAVPLTRRLKLTAGADWLFGDATQQSRNFAYLAALDGSVVPPPSGARHTDEIDGIADKRRFGGLYAQLDWKPSDRLGVLGGLRLNDTREEQLSTHVDTTGSTNNGDFPDSRHDVRLSGDLGGTLRLWGEGRGAEHGILFAQYSNNFKPAAIDFGPDVSERILEPENAGGYQGGLRVKSLHGELEWEIAAFRLDFTNLVVSQTSASGAPVLANAGGERFEGAEGELHWRVAPGTMLTASYSYHDTRFGNALALESGTLVQLDGHQLNLSPHNLAALGVRLAAPRGLEFASQLAYVGRRFLDRLNTAPVGGYLTLDARLGIRRGQVTVALQGENLTDRRDPVTESEFGDQSYYLLPARQVMLSVTTDLAQP